MRIRIAGPYTSIDILVRDYLYIIFYFFFSIPRTYCINICSNIKINNNININMLACCDAVDFILLEFHIDI